MLMTAVPTADTKLTDVLETEDCGRCGGTGHYSYNQIDGTRCYGCGGKGTRYTKRGRAARDYWRWLLTTEARFIAAGERIWVDGGPFSRSGWKTVESVEARPGEGRIHIRVKGGLSMGEFSDSPVLCAPKPFGIALIKAVACYQENLTKAGTPRKRVKN